MIDDADRSATDPAVELGRGWDPDPSRSLSLHADAYTEPRWFDADRRLIEARTWQWIGHGEKLREPGSYVADTVAGRSVVVVRDRDRELRAFYNVCQHRAHELVTGSGRIANLVCPYHAWTYDLTGRLRAARHTDHLVDFDPAGICLDPVRVEEFAGFIWVNLDPDTTATWPTETSCPWSTWIPTG